MVSVIIQTTTNNGIPLHGKLGSDVHIRCSVAILMPAGCRMVPLWHLYAAVPRLRLPSC